MSELRPEMFDPSLLLYHIKTCTKFDAALVERIITEWKEYKATGLTPEEIRGSDEMLRAFIEHNRTTEYPRTLDWLLRITKASSEGRLIVQPWQPGDEVFVVERDEIGEACDFSGYMFLASVGDYAIVSAYINDIDSIDETMEYHCEETSANYDTDLSVFPLSDCYGTHEEAEEALKETHNGE